MKRVIIIKKIITVGKLNRCWCIVNIDSGRNQTRSVTKSICSCSIFCIAVLFALFLILVLKLYQSRNQRSRRPTPFWVHGPFWPLYNPHNCDQIHFCTITLFQFHSFALSFFHTFTYSHFINAVQYMTPSSPKVDFCIVVGTLLQPCPIPMFSY